MVTVWHVVFTKRAAKDATRLKAAGLDGKTKHLIEVVKLDPFGYLPAYEALVGSLSGLYSRRMSIQHRFVYSIDPTPVEYGDMFYEGTVKVIRMWTYYEKL